MKKPLSPRIADPTPEQEVDELVRLAVRAAADRKAERLRVLDLSGVTSLTDYFLICHGTNPRQVQAISDAVERTLRERSRVRPLHVEGREGGRWILLDYGDFVFHVFGEEQRDFYGLEKLWGDAPDVSGDFEPPPGAVVES